jgi:hypothetical protein
MRCWIIVLVMLTSCCDRECGKLVWNEYLEREQDIKHDMDELTPERQTFVWSSYLDSLDRMNDKYPHTSDYRMKRDARERRLLRAKRTYISVQRDIDLDRCYCLYDRDLEQEARSEFR